MFPMVWSMWFSIDPLEQFSLGGSPYAHFQMCTSCALVPFSKKIHKMTMGINLY
jgi:hypothetical protein